MISKMIRLGDCQKYCKTRNPEMPDWHCYEDLVTISPYALTQKLLTENPYEYIGPITKLFFDYDEHNEDTEYIMNQRKEIRDRLCEHRGNYTNGFVFTESASNPNKVSFHVIFKDIYIIRKEFQKEDEYELFTKLVGEKNFEHIDPQVYGNKTCFRLPYGTRGSQGHSEKIHPHIPYNGNNEPIELAEYVLTVPEDTETKFYSTALGRQMKKQCEEDQRNYTKYIPEEGVESPILSMLSLVNCERFKNYSLWCSLMTLMKTHKLSQDLFIEMSQKSGYERFDELVCRKKWRECKENSSFGIPTVIGWLKKDGIDVSQFVAQTISKDLIKIYFKNKEFTDLQVADQLYKHYKDKLIYTGQGWFHYTDRWTLGDASSIFAPVMRFLSKDLTDRILKDILQENKRAERDREENIKRDNTTKKNLETMLKHANKLQSASKIKSVLEVAQGIFQDDTALETFDTKPHWFCFNNQKAFDLQQNKIVDICATDRILTTCGYDLPEDSEENKELVETMLKGLVPKESYKSLISSMSLFTYGENINEALIIYKGEGRNGKGMTMTLLKKTLGNYYYDLPSEVLTEHAKGDGRAKPELAQCRWARCVMFSEPDAGKNIVKTTINTLTGRDTITVRQLHKEPFSYMPKFVLAGMCNDIPKVSGGIGDSIKMRMKHQLFPYTFIEEPTPDTNERKADIRLKEQVRSDNRFRDGLLWLLLQTWVENQGKYISCESDLVERQAYEKENNPVLDWLELYEPSVECIRMKDLFKTFKDSCGDKITNQQFKRFLIDAKIKIEEDKKHSDKVFLKKR